MNDAARRALRQPRRANMRCANVNDGSVNICLGNDGMNGMGVEKGIAMELQRLRPCVAWCAMILGVAVMLGSGSLQAEDPGFFNQLVVQGVNGGGQEADDSADDDIDRLLEALDKEPEEAAPRRRRRAAAPEARPERAPAHPAARRSARRAAARGGNVNPATIFDELGLSKGARAEEAEQLVQQAEAALAGHELLRAEGLLDQARRLDPSNGAADRLYSQVQLLLGNSTDSVATIARDIRDQQRVEREQARAEVRRMINDAYRYEESNDYNRSVDSYEGALDAMRRFPFDLDLDDLRSEAERRLSGAKAKLKSQDAEETRRFNQMMRETADRERHQDMERLENQIRELRRKANTAEEREDFDRAITFYERILALNPRDDRARRQLYFAGERRHVFRRQDLLERAVYTYNVAIVSLEESSVVYQQIFRYPDRREWLRISPKVVSIQDEIAAQETDLEREIKNTLEQLFVLNFEDTPVEEVLRNFQQVSGVNFILTKEGAEAVDGKSFTFSSVTELSLKDYLDFLLDDAGEEDARFNWTIKEGAIVIGPKDSLKRPEYLRFYEMSDLIQVHPDFTAPKIALDELAGKSSSGQELSFDVGEDEQTSSLGPEKILDLIRKELFGEDEEEDGEAAVSLHGGKLSARLTLDKHLKLSKLLNQFRNSTGMMVTVESRFLDIQDNFLEEIGVSFGSTGNTFLPNSIPDIDGAGKSVSPGFEYVNNEGDFNSRIASIGDLSQPLGSRVNPFNMSAAGGGAYQLNVLNVEKYQLEAILTGVAKEQEIRRLNSPRVTAQNGQSAHTLVVNQSAYIQDLEVNQTGVIPVINPVIGVLNSGSILEVRPTVSHDKKYVVLEVQPTLAEQLDPDVAVLNLSGNFTVVPVELPVLAVTKIKTTVTVPDGGTVLVGGLKREVSTKARIGVPGLMSIPFVNYLFGRRGNSTLRSNLFVLLNARITIVREEEARLFGS